MEGLGMSDIENVSYYDCLSGTHKNYGDDTILIRILDNDNVNPPSPAKNFREAYNFWFLDVGEDVDVFDKNYKFNPEMAKRIVEILKKALAENLNVVVHCTVGLCRSGAVTEVGVMMGMNAVHNSRQPNSFVKKLMMRELGWTYDRNR